MKCPVCGGAELVHDTRDLSHTHKGKSTAITAVAANWCPPCGESLMGPDESRRVMAEMRAFNEKVDADAMPAC